MLLVLDNYDSFTYNLVQYLGELGTKPVVYRNDKITVDGALALKPAALVLSPGPKTPEEAGILVPLVKAAAGQVPILGVCLGHQAIAVAFGGAVVRADRLMHGKSCPIVHEDDELFEGIPSPFTGMRYHSLVADLPSLPADLVPTAWAGDQPRPRGRNHGHEAPPAPGLRRTIPSGVHRNGTRQAVAGELLKGGARGRLDSAARLLYLPPCLSSALSPPGSDRVAYQGSRWCRWQESPSSCGSRDAFRSSA